jgi:hypothetical protein
MKKASILTKIALPVFLAGGFLFTACNKEATVISPEAELATIESTQEDSEADLAYDDVFNNTMGIGNEAGDNIGFTSGTGVFGRANGSGVIGRTERCFTVTVVPADPGKFPKTVTLDFKTGCEGPDGKIRKGKIITVYSGPMRAPGSKATTTFDGYMVDSMKVEGTHEVTNNSTSNNQILTMKVIAGKLTWTSGRWVKWGSTRTITQLEGNGTPAFPRDDIFKITGAGRGENSRGKSWSHEITEPLIKRFICRWVSKGVIRIRVNAVVGSLDFGNGECDNKAILTINGKTKDITLR